MPHTQNLQQVSKVKSLTDKSIKFRDFVVNIKGAFGEAEATSDIDFAPDGGAAAGHVRLDNTPEYKLTALIAVAATIAGIRCAAPSD